MDDDTPPLPPFAGLRAFHAAARFGRFKDAARELGVTESAISHQVRRLEDFLGVVLFDRSRAGASLTAAGEGYFAGIDPAIARIRDATATLMGPRGRERVSLTVPPSIATLWLIPRLPSFEESCPGIDLQLITTPRLIDMRREQIDLAIRHGAGHWPGLDSRFLFAEQGFPVSRPGYLDADVARDPARAMASARLLVNDLQPDEWTEWAQANGIGTPSLTGAMVLNGLEQVLEATERGLGLAIGRRPMIDERIRAGALVAPFGTEGATGTGYHLCRPEGAETPARVRRVMRWLEATAAGDPQGVSLGS